jgi:hypothetical protein
MDDWDDVVALAMTLPGAELLPFYGVPAPKVNGKAFVGPGREPGSFYLPATHDDKTILLETDPDTFWETPHYRGWPGLLVRYGRERERVETLIRRAWWDRAGKARRSAFGPRP